MKYVPTLPSYEIITKDNKIILCENEQDLNKQLSLLGNNIFNIYRLGSLSTPYNRILNIRLTKGLKERVQNRVKTLGLKKVSEYIRILIDADCILNLIRFPKNNP